MKDYSVYIKTLSDSYKHKYNIDLNVINLLTKIAEWYEKIRKFILNFFISNHIDVKSGNFEFWQKLIIAIIILTALTITIAYLYKIYVKNRSKLKKINDSSQISLLDSNYFENEACEFVAKADYENALRSLYLASITLFVEKKIINYEFNKTNYEIKRILDKYPKYQESFNIIANKFERVFYGEYKIIESEYITCLDAFKQIKE